MDLRYIMLLALYSEYLKEAGDFRAVDNRMMEISGRKFAWALMRLQTEGLIAGCVFQPPNTDNAEQIFDVIRDGMYFTGEGVAKCEELLNVRRDDSDAFKLTKLTVTLMKLGVNVVSELITAYLQ